jgi:aminopeptidase N/puromycin-sensitive aminopeptidase
MKKRFVILLIAAAPAFAARLPQTVIPNHYVLTIAPNLVDETFHGEETIAVDVRQAVSSVTMHAVGLSISGARLNGVEAAVSANPGDETVTFTLTDPLRTGPGTIALSFDGTISKQLRGLYLSKTTARKYAVTQFESTDARRAFPCFDEPAMKATFDISLTVDSGDTAISNGKIISDTPAGAGKHTLRFETTPRLSTYLVAMLVGDFDCIEGGADGIPIRVCGPPGRAAQYGHFALSAAEQAIRFYDQYYGIKYPFGKLDMIAIPDFEAGAMENAGAITYRETAIFYDPKTSSYERQKGIAGTVAHEIAHQWFGDLVTMKWWDDIWLNEGFATFMTAKPLAAWKPEWKQSLTETASTMGSLALDAQRSTRPIRTAAETPQEINQLFDGIAYGKTAAVLRMLEHWMGEETFRDAIRAYLKKYSWSNATAEDFWNTMTAASKRPVDSVMKSFVDQPGAPLLHIDAKCVGGKSSARVSQERFSRSGAQQPLTPDGLKPVPATWNVPICGKGIGCTVVSEPSGNVSSGPCSGAPMFLNANGRGYYVSDYSADDRPALRASIPKLNDAERIALEGNEWLLVASLRRHAGDYLELLEAMPRPASRQLTEAITAHIKALDERLVTDKARDAWRREVRDLMRGYAPLSWEAPAGETAEQRSTRAEVLWTAGYIGRDPEVIAGARSVADRYLRDPSSVDPSIATKALEIAATNGDQELYSRVRERLTSAPTAEMRDRFAAVLVQFRDPKLIAQTIDYTYSDAVRTQDLPRLIARLFTIPEAREAAWIALTERWPQISRSIPTALHTVTAGLSSFCEPESRQAIEAYFAKTPPAEGLRNLRRSLESINTCIAFRQAQQASFEQALMK